MKARTLGAAATVLTAAALTLGTPSMAHADPQAAFDQYASTRQGSNRATFDRINGDFDVCDKEADGRAVYVYFSATAEDGNYYYDNTSGCTNYSGTKSDHAGIMYVCEERPVIWDPCSDGVVTYWKL